MTEKKIYILLTNTGSMLTKLIKLYTKKPYNHASISFDSELVEVYSFGRKNVHNPFHGGFVKEDTTKGLFQEAECTIYSLTVTEMEILKMKKFIDEVNKKKETYRYNFLGLFGFLLNKPISRKNAFFCSQFVASVLEKCDGIYFNKPTPLIAPHDFQTNSYFRLVFEGKLKEYHHKYIAEKISGPLQFIAG